MKKLMFLWVLVCVSLCGNAQNTDKIKQELEKIKKSVSDIETALKPSEPEPPTGDSCKRGPKPEDVLSITQTGATILFDGDGVFGWDYTISQNGSVKANGSRKPESNKVPITYNLEPGTYTLGLQGNTCASKVYTHTFVIPKTTGDGGDNGGTSPPPVQTDRKYTYQIIMGTTGSGFKSEATHGIDDQWVERIEATKYSNENRYWLSGITVWTPWDNYEKTKGVYEEAAFKRLIKFCRERNLSLSVAFFRSRHQNDKYDVLDSKGNKIGEDYFIRPDEIITGSGGSQYVEGVPGYGKIYAGYANDRVNELSAGAIKSISKLLATYEKSLYISLAGGGAGEQVNYVFDGRKGFKECADISPDNQSRYDEWRAARGIAQPGLPIFIQGPGNDWPHPDYNNPNPEEKKKAEEFGRWTTFGIYKAYSSFVDAVKSVSAIPCVYQYSVTSNLQFRSIQNPNINFIASKGDGLYGSDGANPENQYAKLKVNRLNLGTFPHFISTAEQDVEDITWYQLLNGGKAPPYCVGGIQYNIFENTTRTAFSQGLMIMHLAMAYCPDELRGFEPTMRSLEKDYLGHPYVWPTVDASNTVTVNVTDLYRHSIDLMDAAKKKQDDPGVWEENYVKYTDEGFWGGVSPFVK